MDENVPFAHEPLDQSLAQIRLISVIPEADGPLRCTIKHVTLDTNPTPDYRALSYIWGPPSPTCTIFVNDRPLIVRANLHGYLLAFRKRLHNFRGFGVYKDETQWLWVDQICIDQTIIEERNHQVQMMSSIYRQATYVYVWLGSSDERTEAAMQALKTGFRQYHDERFLAAAKKKRASKRKTTSSVEGERSQAESIGAMQQFFRNPYWQRLWIVQEVMLARYIRIICGDTLLSWEELRRFCISGFKALPAGFVPNIPTQTTWLAEHALSAKTYALNELLCAFRESQCENPRDRVYGLQGLLAQEERVEIDYGKTVEEVYFDAAHIICKGPRILSHVGSDSLYSHINFCDSVGSMVDEVCKGLEKWVVSVRIAQAEILGKSISDDLGKDSQVSSHEYWALRDIFWKTYNASNEGRCKESGCPEMGGRLVYAREWGRYRWYGALEPKLSPANSYREKKHIMAFMLKLTHTIKSRTRHIETTNWTFDIFLPRKFRFRNEINSVTCNCPDTIEFGLIRDTSWAIDTSDDTELEVRFQPQIHYIGMSSLQIIFRESASGEASIAISVSISHNPMWFPRIRYLSCNLDVADLNNLGNYDRGTVVTFSQVEPSSQSSESVLAQDSIVRANTFVDVGGARLKQVWTGRSKRYVSSEKTLKNEIMFWRSIAVGYRR